MVSETAKSNTDWQQKAIRKFLFNGGTLKPPHNEKESQKKCHYRNFFIQVINV